MHEFYIWFTTGIEHIADWKAYDHILFLLALCGIYPLSDWKKILFNVTAFTIGHSITLALSVINIIKINTSFVEFLIPVTILITCLLNLKNWSNSNPDKIRPAYWLACFFGLIHGLGFSTLLKEMLGGSSNVVLPLFSFNIGLEVGQLFIIIAVMIFSVALTSLLRIKQTNWNFFISSAVFGIAFIMAAERFIALIN